MKRKIVFSYHWGKFEKVLMLVGYGKKEKVMQFYFIQSIQPVYIEDLFCARQFTKLWEPNSEQN